MKRIVLIISVMLAMAVMLVMAAACDTAIDVDDTLIVGYSTPSLQNSFWISVTNGMQKKADELGMTLRVRECRE